MDSEGKVKIICQTCDVQITPGLTKRRLFNVRQHFMDSSCHKAEVISLAGRDNISSESVVSLDMDEGKKIAFLKKISPSTFELKGSHVVCSCCVNLNPNRGSFENNVRSHLQSKQHTAAAKGKKQGTLDSLFGTKASLSSPQTSSECKREACLGYHLDQVKYGNTN